MRNPTPFWLIAYLLVAPALAQTTQPQSDSAAETAMIEPQRVVFDASISPELKVQKAATGHLLVPAMINGKNAGWFILDTGAGMSCVDKQIAEDLKLAEGGAVTARGMGGQSESKLRRFDTLAVGPLRVEQGVLLELNLKPYGLIMGEKIAGIIGHECFGGGVFDIDFAKGAASVFDPAKYQLADGASWTEMKIVKRRPAVHGSIEGSEQGLFTVDSGSNEGVYVYAPTVKKLKLLENRKTGGALSGGVGGMKKVRHGKLTTVDIGGCIVSDVNATFSEATEGTPSDDDVLGTVGLKLLEQFRMIINQPAGKVAMLRVESPSTSPTTKPAK